MSDIILELDFYIGNPYKEDKDTELNKILKSYVKDNNGIYEKMIKKILRCHKCDYIMDLNNIIHIYECYNCEDIYCEKCVIHCTDCNLFDDLIENIHCINCKNKCFRVINKQLEKNNYNNEYIKKIIFDTYKKFISDDYLDEMRNHDFIDKLETGDNIKKFLKFNSNDL